MYKMTEVIARPRNGVTIEDLELDAYVALLRDVPFVERLELAVCVEVEDLPEPTHSAVIEGWFSHFVNPQQFSELPSAPEIDARATRLHEQAGIERWFSQVI
jgi:hypothetical protein